MDILLRRKAIFENSRTKPEIPTINREKISIEIYVGSNFKEKASFKEFIIEQNIK